MKKKLVALLLIASMATTALIGCGKTGEVQTSSSAEEKSEVSAEASKSEETPVEDDGIFNATGYPVVDEPITLSVMLPITNDRAGNLAENTAWAELSEITGVEFEFIEVPNGEYNEELSLTLASGELPDIILKMESSSDLQNSMKVGSIVDLAPYIEQYAPNVKAVMENVEGMKQGITLPTGEIASLPYMNMMAESGKCPQSLFILYQPWLDKLNLKVPHTAEELYDVLVAFKTQDPNGNGQADEIPLLPRNVNDMYNLFGMFGVLVQQNSYFYADGEDIKFSPFMDEFKAGLEYITKLYQEGLIHKDVFTLKTSEVLAIGSGEVPVVGSSITAAAFVVVGDERNDDMVLAPELVADGYDPVWLNRTVVNPGRFVVTKDCEYPEVAVRVIDYMFSEEGAKLLWMGPEENYTYKEDGTWTWNLKDGETVEEIRARATMQTVFSFAAAFTTEWFKQDAGSETLANEQRYLMGTEYADNLRLVIPKLNYEKEVAEELNVIVADLNAYVRQSMASFITGELDIEKDWNDFVKNCQNMRVDEALEMTQAAYDVYLGK